MKTLELKNPILINGEKVSKLKYDENEITGVLFAEADTRKRTNSSGTVAISPAAEFDFALHTYLGYAAIIAVNPNIDWSDLERIKGNDVIAVTRIGRNFMLGVSEEDSQGETSEEPTETSAESIIPALTDSNENGLQTL